MASKIKGFRLWLHYVDESRELVIDYRPVAVEDDGAEHSLDMYWSQLRPTEVPEGMQRKLARLADYVRQLLPAPEVEIDGVPLRGSPILIYYQVLEGGRIVNASDYTSAGKRNPTSARFAEELSAGARRLIENLFPMAEQLAWTDLRKRLGASAKPKSNDKKKVLISYRKGSEERRTFVKA